jgi:hypothetical protein
LVIQELEFIKRRQDMLPLAATAIKNIRDLLKQGTITDGIHVENVGWFISVSGPNTNVLHAELEQLDSVVKAFHEMDATFLLMARDINTAITNVLTFVLSGDNNFSNTLEFRGIHSFQATSFPLVGFEEVVRKTAFNKIDWDEKLKEIQLDVKNKSIEMYLTLKSKSTVPAWTKQFIGDNNDKSIVLAAGYGTLRRADIADINFLWEIPYKKYVLKKDQNNSSTQSNNVTGVFNQNYLSSANLDFLGKQEQIPVVWMKGLIAKIKDCVNPCPSDFLPTLQSPTSVIQMSILLESLSRLTDSGTDITPDIVNEIKNSIGSAGYGGLVDYCMDDILVDFPDGGARNVFISFLLGSVNNCWEIGETKKIIMMPEEGEK